MFWVNWLHATEHHSEMKSWKGDLNFGDSFFFPPLGGSVPQKVSANSLVSLAGSISFLSSGPSFLLSVLFLQEHSLFKGRKRKGNDL